MRKKVALSVAAAAMVGTLAVGGTLAWFTDTETATNVVTTGNVDIAWYENGEKITEENPGVNFGGENDNPVAPGATLEKLAKVVNEGKNRAIVRAKIELDQSVENVVEPVLADEAEEYWEYDETTGYYYYKMIINPDGETTNLITDLKVSEELGNEIANIDNANVELIAEAIQADNMEGLEGKETITLEEAVAAFGDNEIIPYETTAVQE